MEPNLKQPVSPRPVTVDNFSMEPVLNPNKLGLGEELWEDNPLIIFTFHLLPTLRSVCTPYSVHQLHV